ncbi:MAG: DUF1805 domain-containing protein [Clostridia bacterium]|nr:DUF1805 domain-containing protein [Clostridia bacterium]
MVTLTPVELDRFTAVGVTVDLPRTRLVALAAGDGYIMCGALDVELLDARLSERGIVAGRAVGVRSIEDLLEAPLERVTHAARAIGIEPGMKGREALLRMARYAGALRDPAGPPRSPSG